ncbi:MAG: acetate kinase, partial [Pseudolabrys sp.]
MDAILVVNAGSSSLKFQVFASEGGKELHCLVKGQMDGIGTKPRLRAEDADKSSLIDQTYPAEKVPDLPAATQETGDWLRRTQKVNLVAVGHRVVHGGPDYSLPVRVTPAVVAQLERYVSLAPLHQPNNLAPIRA